MNSIKIVILQCTCSVNNEKIMNLVKTSISRYNNLDFKIINAGYSEIDYWDSSNTIIFTSVPLVFDVKSHVEIVMDAYRGIMPQEKFDDVMDKSVNDIKNTEMHK